MKKEKIVTKTACDMPGCGNIAEYSFSLSGSKRFSIGLCGECALAIAAALADDTRPDGKTKDRVAESGSDGRKARGRRA